MTRFLLAGALVAGAFLTASPAAQACTIDTCPYLKPVCDRVDCAHPICFETPEISYCP